MQTSISKTPIKKGDMVQVMAGKEKGKTGKVLGVLREESRVFIEKLNMIKRHTRPTQSSPQGGIVEKEAALHLSKVLLLCPKCNKGVRIGRKISGDRKLRVCKKCGSEI